MSYKKYIVESKSQDPWYNLAVEEYLFKEYAKDSIIMYLWRNDNTVVIGQNQNAWKECNVDKINLSNGKIARRLSGGGAVFHDAGNLNFTFLVPRKIYDVHRQLKVILDAVKSFGVEAKFTGRNDLTVDDKKFSGNAFCVKKDRAFHHGTILMKSDMSKLKDYLNVSKTKMKSKGVKSVKSRVINLNQLNENINVKTMIDALTKSFVNEYGVIDERIDFDPKSNPLCEFVDKFSSWEYIYGKTPAFDLVLENRFSFGELQIGFKSKKGRIDEARVYTDSMEIDIFKELEESFKGIKFEKKEILDVLKKYAIKNRHANEIVEWFERIEL